MHQFQQGDSKSRLQPVELAAQLPLRTLAHLPDLRQEHVVDPSLVGKRNRRIHGIRCVWRIGRALFGLTLMLSLASAAATSTLAAQAPTAPAPPTGAPVLSASLRVRSEQWDWFGNEPAGKYGFVGALLRVGLSQAWTSASWSVELAAPALVGLPDNAIAPAPRGQLGFGGTYSAANDRDNSPASVFVKQAYVRFGQPPSRGGHALRVGRFEFVDGTEMIPRHATLAALKRDHIAHRLLGTFGWTHVGRSLDGALYSFDRPGRVNVTALGALPTRGVFDVKGMSSLDVRIGYAAATKAFAWRGGSGEWRLFSLAYQDRRTVLKTDNRPLAVRQGDAKDIRVGTLGAHYLHVVKTGVGDVDLLLWGALQGGDWGGLTQRGSAGAAEIGFQPGSSNPLRPALVQPWVRAGWFRGSGDVDPSDGRNGTFFQVLPTPRIYARMPFYNLMNLEDVFGSLSLRTARVTLRAEVHGLRLAESADLWYQGGGAFERQTFGYVGRPSGGSRGLATLLDVGADVRLGALTLSAYAANASQRAVIMRLFPGGAGRLFYLEAELRR